jgi:hypothetical protein
MKKLKYLFITYVIILFLSFLDYRLLGVNLVDYNWDLKLILSFLIPILFLIGNLFGFICLFNKDDALYNKKTAKTILSLFYIISPLTIYSIFAIAFGKLSFNDLGNDLFFMIPLPFAFLPIFLVLVIYFYDQSWSTAKKIFLGIFGFIISVSIAFVMFFITLIATADKLIDIL